MITTPLDPRVKDAFVSALELYGNASSMHEDGRRIAALAEAARAQVASLINADPSEIIFTPGGSESDNTVFNAMAEADAFRAQAIKSALPGGKLSLRLRLSARARRLGSLGFDVAFLPVDPEGVADGAAYREALSRRGALLVSIMAANNEIGTIQDIRRLAALAHEAGAPFHADAAGCGKNPR